MKKKAHEIYHAVKKYFLNDVLGNSDSAHRIALGFAIGLFVALTPTMPFQMMMTVVFSWVFGANKVAGLPVVWLTNPATIIPVYLPQYLFGSWLLGHNPKEVRWEELTEFQGGFFEYGNKVYDFVLDIFWPLWTGSLIISSVSGIVSYYVIKSLVQSYRKRKVASES